MGLQPLLVFGGVIVLVVALTVKALVMRTPFQRVAVAFTILWASFVACHFWQSAMLLLQLVVRGDSDEIRLLGSFWLAFALGCVPGVVMIQAWMRNWDPDLPEWFERTAGGLAATLVGLLLVAHLLMSLEITVPQVRDFMASETTPSRIVRSFSRATLRTYWYVGARVCRISAADLAQERNPVYELRSIRQKGARARQAETPSSAEDQP